jgi:elongation factor P
VPPRRRHDPRPEEEQEPLATTADIRNGLVIEHKNELWRIVEFQHVKPGKGGAFVRTKLKNLRTGRVVDETWNSGERIQDVRLEPHEVQFLYASGDEFHFMNTETYDQIALGRERLGDQAGFLKDGTKLTLLMNGEQIVTVEFPQMVELAVVETEETAARGDTARAFQKPARMETGIEVMVPGFIKGGDVIKVDTTTGKYVERV